MTKICAWQHLCLMEFPHNRIPLKGKTALNPHHTHLNSHEGYTGTSYGTSYASMVEYESTYLYIHVLPLHFGNARCPQSFSPHLPPTGEMLGPGGEHRAIDKMSSASLPAAYFSKSPSALVGSLQYSIFLQNYSETQISRSRICPHKLFLIWQIVWISCTEHGSIVPCT